MHPLDGIDVKEVTVDFSFTKNLGNFQTVKLMCGATARVQDGAAPADVDRITDGLWDFATKQVAAKSKIAGSITGG